MGGSSGSGGAWQCPATVTTAPGENTVTITVDGTARTFIQHLPPMYTGKTPMPVVIDFHGRGGSASSWKSATGWDSLADQQGFIMIWPDGVGNTWNAGRCCGGTVDDVAFVREIIATLKKDVCIDPKRVYATGCSAGGGMTYKVGCDAADLIAAVAPVDFDCAYSSDNTGNTPSCGGCKPARPISEIQFRGTADAMALYDGGIRSGGTNYHAGALKNFAEWGQINQCTGTPAAMADHPACEEYPSCGGDADTILCTVQNGSHCGSYQSFGIVNIAWEMFQKHALP
jgi:polyhydroxybutyrate depolymerase